MIELKQKSMKDFLASGGKTSDQSNGTICSLFVNCASSITHPLFPMHTGNGNFKTNIPLFTMYSSCKRLAEEKDPFRNVNIAGKNMCVTSIQFDSEGSLFCVARSNGSFQVYDFDEYLYTKRRFA